MESRLISPVHVGVFIPNFAFCSALRISGCLAGNLRRKKNGIVLCKSFKR